MHRWKTIKSTELYTNDENAVLQLMLGPQKKGVLVFFRGTSIYFQNHFFRLHAVMENIDGQAYHSTNILIMKNGIFSLFWL